MVQHMWVLRSTAVGEVGEEVVVGGSGTDVWVLRRKSRVERCAGRSFIR